MEALLRSLDHSALSGHFGLYGGQINFEDTALAKLGVDPFTASEDVYFPVTMGDFIKFYQDAAQAA